MMVIVIAMLWRWWWRAWLWMPSSTTRCYRRALQLREALRHEGLLRREVEVAVEVAHGGSSEGKVVSAVAAKYKVLVSIL
jgi:hypothetical protein